MKNFRIMAITGMLSLSLAASAAVVITETPVELQRQGDVYVVPSDATAKYYYYTDNNMRYVCTAETVDVANVNPVTLNVTMGTNVVATRCYPSTYFVTESR